jgi:hypothetical protein
MNNHFSSSRGSSHAFDTVPYQTLVYARAPSATSCIKLIQLPDLAIPDIIGQIRYVIGIARGVGALLSFEYHVSSCYPRLVRLDCRLFGRHSILASHQPWPAVADSSADAENTKQAVDAT